MRSRLTPQFCRQRGFGHGHVAFGMTRPEVDETLQPANTGEENGLFALSFPGAFPGTTNCAVSRGKFRMGGSPPGLLKDAARLALAPGLAFQTGQAQGRRHKIRGYIMGLAGQVPGLIGVVPALGIGALLEKNHGPVAGPGFLVDGVPFYGLAQGALCIGPQPRLDRKFKQGALNPGGFWTQFSRPLGIGQGSRAVTLAPRLKQ
jgi:hypothetical protein